MRIKEPFDITCPQCGQHFYVTVNWLLEPGRQCPQCAASFAERAAPLRKTIQDETDLFQGVEFIMEAEARWQITISDDDACSHTSAGSIHTLVLDLLHAWGRSTDPHEVWAGLREFASQKLAIHTVTPDTQLLDSFRRVIIDGRDKT